MARAGVLLHAANAVLRGISLHRLLQALAYRVYAKLIKRLDTARGIQLRILGALKSAYCRGCCCCIVTSCGINGAAEVILK